MNTHTLKNKKLICVKDVMTDHFIEIDGLKTVNEALGELIKDSARVLIVKKRNEHDEYGIVLLSDIAKKVLAKDRAPDRMNVYEVMTKPVISVKPTMDVRYCARLFNHFGLTLAPVIENEKVIGIVDYHALVLKGLVQLFD